MHFGDRDGYPVFSGERRGELIYPTGFTLHGLTVYAPAVLRILEIVQQWTQEHRSPDKRIACGNRLLIRRGRENNLIGHILDHLYLQLFLGFTILVGCCYGNRKNSHLIFLKRIGRIGGYHNPCTYPFHLETGKVAMGNHGSQGILYAFLYFQSFGRHIQIDGRGQQIPHFHFHLFFGMTVFVVYPQRNIDLPRFIPRVFQGRVCGNQFPLYGPGKQGMVCVLVSRCDDQFPTNLDCIDTVFTIKLNHWGLSGFCNDNFIPITRYE